MSKKKPITVTLKKGKHKTQPWTFDIDDPGPGPKLTAKERYTRKSTAKRGALRKLLQGRIAMGIGWQYYDTAGRPIVFVTKTSKK